MPYLRHARDYSRSNKSEALSVLSTWESATMVSLSTTAHGAKLGEYSEGKATRNRALAVYKSGALRSVNTLPSQHLSDGLAKNESIA